MLDKNPDQRLVGINEAKKYLEQNTLSSILCNEPSIKAAFLSELINQIDIPIIYLDFDLLYSGFTNAGILPKKKNVSLFLPDKNIWNQTLKKTLMMILNEKSIVVIDSLNGFYNLFDEKDVGRLVNVYIMLLAFVAKESGTSILFVSIARKKNQEGWVLSPTGRRVIDAKLITKLYLKRFDSGIKLDVLGDDGSIINSIKLSTTNS